MHLTARLTLPLARGARYVAKEQGSLSAEDRLRKSFGRLFAAFVAVAALVHAVLIFFLVTPRGIGYEGRADELVVVPIPPEIQIPPPPEEIARPATPVIAAGPDAVDEDITIAETDIRQDQPLPEAPPPLVSVPAEREVASTYTFTPYTVAPRCKTACSSEDVIRHVPPLLKRVGFRCALTLGIRIDTNGNVTATDMLTSSGNSACDSAAQEWAWTTTWTVAYNRDQPVAVWIAQPLAIETI